MRRTRNFTQRYSASGALVNNRRSEQGLRKSYLHIRISPAPDQWKTGGPILPVDGLPCMRVFFRGQDACYGGDLGSGRLPAYGAWSDHHLGIVANALCLPHIAARHHIKPIAIFSKPDRSSDACTAFSERGERDVFMVVNCRRYLSGHIESQKALSDKVGIARLLYALSECGCHAWFVKRLSRLIRPSHLC
jgi:hypothetical protein